MGRLDGKVVLVTGGGQGFGRAYCLGLAREGATVAVADINEETADETRSMVEEQGGRAIVTPVDVRDEASVLAMRDAVDSQLGGIDGLVNNAGIFPRIELADITKEMWDHIYNINVWGSFIVGPRRFPLHAATWWRKHREHQQFHLPDSSHAACGLYELKGGDHGPHPCPGHRVGRASHSCEYHPSRPNRY